MSKIGYSYGVSKEEIRSKARRFHLHQQAESILLLPLLHLDLALDLGEKTPVVAYPPYPGLDKSVDEGE